MNLILLQPGSDAILNGETNVSLGSAALIEKIDYDFGKRPCIELVSVHQGMKQQVTTDVSNTARTSGRAFITDFTCVKNVDKASVKFYEHCLRVKPLGVGATEPTKIFICHNVGEKTMNILSFSLRDALISEMQLQTNGDDMPTEELKLNFTELLWEYVVKNGENANIDRTASGWSIARNRPIHTFS